MLIAQNILLHRVQVMLLHVRPKQLLLEVAVQRIILLLVVITKKYLFLSLVITIYIMIGYRYFQLLLRVVVILVVKLV